MLRLCEPSPPVPTMSIAPSGASTRSILSRIVATAPEISSTVSPRTRSAIRKPPIWPGVASPDMMMSKASRASSKESGLPAATLAMWSFSVAHLPRLERQRLVDRRAVDRHAVFALQPGDQLVEQVVGHAGREDFCASSGTELASAPAGSNTSVTLNSDLRVAGRRGDQPGAALGDAEDRRDAGAGRNRRRRLRASGRAWSASRASARSPACRAARRPSAASPARRPWRPAASRSRPLFQSATTLAFTSSSVRSRAGVMPSTS